MSPSIARRCVTLALLGAFAGIAPGCVADGGYAYPGTVGVGVDYYEPYGAVYGGWGPGYYVGPVRDGYRGSDRAGYAPGSHSYRSAPTSGSVPSIPRGARSGGARTR